MAGRPPGPIRWGWHRLADHWAADLVARAGVRPGDLVVDLGAGTGALTAPLVAAGAHVVAVELHPERVAQLRARFAGDPVTVVRADITQLRLPRRPFTVVANPPFAIVAGTVRLLTQPQVALRRADLVVPLHTARRILTRRLPPGLHASVDARIPRSAFSPRPSVDVAVLTIRRSNR
ncbi:MAG: rRNA adenine N-6-methyltransferase family protein [Ilumatobacteraceae bacterium]